VTLRRPPKIGNLLTPSLETSVEQQMLAELRAAVEKIDGVAGQVRDMRNNLMGSGEPDRETSYGRLPMVEATVKALDSRVDRLEKSIIRYVGLASGAGFVIGVLLHFLWK
jgi:hypothetical protein